LAAFLSAIAEAVKQYLLPGSLLLLLIAFTLGIVWWYLKERHRKLIRAGLTAVIAAYWLLATPAVAGGLETILVGPYQPLQDEEAVGAIVLLGGGAQSYRFDGRQLVELSGASALRALEAARLYGQLHPDLVIASGGPGRDPTMPESEPLAQALAALGVPSYRILAESQSSDTHEQAVQLAPILAQHGVTRFVLVTSPTHIRRAMMAFRAVGLDPIASVAPDRSQTAQAGPALLPSHEALQDSVVAMREVLGLAYYWLRGWI
jgi:uncharacterized SAM-binding protein YcdF (DUF218 family)